MDESFEPLQVALRVHAVRNDESVRDSKRDHRGRKSRRLEPHRTIVLDTETTTDPAQRLLFGVWRYYIDRWNSTAGRFCVTEGILYADDLPDSDPEGFAQLQAYVDSHRADVAPGRATRIRFLSRSEFVEKVLWRHAHENQSTVVGFNLPFDLSRLAVAASAARGRAKNTTYAGGHSLRLFENERFRPRIDYKAIDSKRTLIGFTTANGATRPTRGHFLDLRTLTFALTDRGHSLESACESFGVPYTKREVTHGTITDDYVTYCREDVTATARLFRAAMAEYDRHPIDLQPTRAFSPASIGKAYLAAAGIRPILERQPDFDPKVLGWAMSAFFGGRAECRTRKVPLPVVYVDFLSMYPTVNALMGTWGLVTATRIATDDATARVRRLLRAPNLFEQCFRKSFWRKLPCMVEIEPAGDLLPVRASYDPASTDFGIGINPYRYRGSAWYALADVVASVVLTGRVPKVIRAIALRGVGRQRGLKEVRLRGEIDIDPADTDFFRRVIELRKEVDSDQGRGEVERNRLTRSLKVLANSTSYGILAEYVRNEQRRAVPVTVYADGDEPFESTTTAPERPGPYCFPPLAAVITAGARLMLALLERCVTDAGGSYVFCDTDSMGIVADLSGDVHPCPGGTHSFGDGAPGVHALTWAAVDGIVERFKSLNPYDRTSVPGSILKVEDENFDDSGSQRQLWCWAISAKRYVLYTLGDDGPTLQRVVDDPEEAEQYEPTLAKATEHGLGHLLNPVDPEETSRRWIDQAWEYLLRQALGLPVVEPTWLDRPAISRVTASSPAVLGWFKRLNEEKPYRDQIKPANFLLLAHADPLDPSGALPIAPFESSGSKWTDLPWIDRRNGRVVRITTDAIDGFARPGVVRVRTYRDVITEYLVHPEAKSLGPDGHPVTRRTVGLLRRRPVVAELPTRYIGKEGNRLDDRISGLVTSADEYRNEYVDRDGEWRRVILPALARMDRRMLAKRSGLHQRTIERYIYKGVMPRAAHREVLVRLVDEASVVSMTNRISETTSGHVASRGC